MSIWPRDKAVEVGSEATLRCITNGSHPSCFIWYYANAVNATSQSYRYVCYEYSSNDIFVEPKCNVAIDSNSRTGLLTINNIQLNDSGLYRCSDCHTDESSEARLTVIGKW